MPLDLSNLTPIVIFNFLVGTLFSLCFLYQIVYFLIGIFHGEVKIPAAKRQHRYAFFIAAHNEEAVIANLVQSIRQQDYPSELIDIFCGRRCLHGRHRACSSRGRGYRL